VALVPEGFKGAHIEHVVFLRKNGGEIAEAMERSMPRSDVSASTASLSENWARQRRQALA